MKAILVLLLGLISASAFGATYNCGFLSNVPHPMGAPVYSVIVGASTVTVVEHQNDTYPPQTHSFNLSKTFQGVYETTWDGGGFTVTVTNGMVSLSDGDASTMCSAAK